MRSATWHSGRYVRIESSGFGGLLPGRRSGRPTRVSMPYRTLAFVSMAPFGGFAIGFAESAASTYLTFEFLGTGFGGVVPYLVMLLVLLIRPYGLFGTEEIRRV